MKRACTCDTLHGYACELGVHPGAEPSVGSTDEDSSNDALLAYMFNGDGLDPIADGIAEAEATLRLVTDALGSPGFDSHEELRLVARGATRRLHVLRVLRMRVTMKTITVSAEPAPAEEGAAS